MVTTVEALRPRRVKPFTKYGSYIVVPWLAVTTDLSVASLILFLIEFFRLLLYVYIFFKYDV